jgi:hypothetical protein
MQSTFYNITTLYCANTLWCSGQQYITCLKRHHPADILQLSWYSEEHELSIVILSDLIVYGEGKHRVVRIRDQSLWNEVTDGAERIEPFRCRPRKTFLLCFVLNVSCGEINGYYISCASRCKPILILRTIGNLTYPRLRQWRLVHPSRQSI